MINTKNKPKTFGIVHAWRFISVAELAKALDKPVGKNNQIT